MAAAVDDVGERLHPDVQAGGEFRRGGHAGAAHLAEHLLLAEGEAVVAAVGSELPGQGHDRLSQLGRIRGRDVVGAAGLGVLPSHVTGISPLEGYLSTSPGGIYAVLATAVETGSNVTFIIAAQVVRVLLMLLPAPLMARGFGKLTERFAYRRASTSRSREPIRVAD